MTRRRNSIICLLFLICSVSGCAHSVPDARPLRPGPVALVDLTHVDFTAGRIYYLPTQWDFFWRRLLSPADLNREGAPVPDARVIGMRPWTEIKPGELRSGARLPGGKGYGSYRMRLRLPPGEYGFRIQQQLMSFRLFLNDELKVEAGRVGTTAAESLPEREQHSFFHRVAPGESEIEIVIQVSNFTMFRGGLRGVLVIGERDAMQTYGNRKVGYDFALLGFFGAVILYHLAFFLMYSRETSFLYFALLAISFGSRIPFMSEKVMNLVLPEVGWAFSLRIMGTLNIISPALYLLFLRSIIPDSISRWVPMTFVFMCTAFLSIHFFDIEYLAPTMFLVYLVIVVPSVIMAALATLRGGLRRSPGISFMGGGILFLMIFGFYAMYLNWRAHDAAPLAMFAFAGMVFFQAIGLSINYRANLDAREKLRQRLERSRAALTAQRKELEINLHDSLGGALTDFKVMIERALDRSGKADFDSRGLLESLLDRLSRTNRMFRGQLLFMEDMELVGRDPVIGLRMILLRRYSGAGREIDFQMSRDVAKRFQNAMIDDRWRLDLLQLTRELCTNDLKYGAGETRWAFAGDEHFLEITQSNRTREAPGNSASTDVASAGAGNGADTKASHDRVLAKRATQRASKMGGELLTGIQDERFEATARIPLALPE